ncbi:MAG: alpha/beta fold hydrolase [Sphingobium sp.]
MAGSYPIGSEAAARSNGSLKRDGAEQEHIRPLARFGGTRPPAPPWFDAALATQPQRSFVDIDGAHIEMLCWGEPGMPGLIFVHGANAHADWWSFIAPFFAGRMRVAALSLSGMGRSGWRDRYSTRTFGREVVAVAEAAGLFQSTTPPVAIGHSFGGVVVAHAMAAEGQRFGGAIIADSIFQEPDKTPSPGLRSSPNRIIASVEEAVMRFRLSPQQDVENAYILDHIARMSLKRVDGGVTWCFDPFIFSNLSEPLDGSVIGDARCQLALMRGERSSLMTSDMLDYTRRTIGHAVPEIIVPDADHHLLIDQPLVFVAAVRAILAVWNP